MKRLVLVGGGHAHAVLLAGWATVPVAGVALSVVTPHALAPYSGMVPGWLAGRFAFEDICADFEGLTARAGATLVRDAAVGVDPVRNVVRLEGGQVLPFDILSLNIGSTLRPPPVAGARILTLRPLGDLRAGWESLLADAASDVRKGPLTIAVAGGGAAGVESLLAALGRLRALLPGRTVEGRLITRSPSILPNFPEAARRHALSALGKAGVDVLCNADAGSIERAMPEVVLWATGAQPHLWPGEGGLAVSAAGFVEVDEHLRSVSHPHIFAVGDCAEWADPLPKAGVYAVRMGPVLAENLRSAVLGQAGLRPYRPQTRALALLSMADGTAVAAWGPFAARGRWASTWKDRIDRGFVTLLNASTEGATQ